MKDKTIDVDGWFIEKTLRSLVEVARAAHHAKELEKRRFNKILPRDEKQEYEYLLEDIVSNLYAALYDLTKVASVLNGERVWDPLDRDMIYDGGRSGLASVIERYGFPDWLGFLGLHDVSPETLAQKESVDDVLRKVRELSEGSFDNRPLIYTELSKISRDTTARIILDLLEPVTQGEKRWVEFQKEIGELFKEG